MLVAAVVFALIVLGTSFPIEGLLSQRSALSSTAHELTTVEAQNDSLSRQVSALANPATVNGLARHDYGFVGAGQRAYDILPASSPSGSLLSGSGQVPLGGSPVVPGSARSQALLGILVPNRSLGTQHADDSTAASVGGSASVTVAPPEPHSYWGRVLKSLEFWN
jgi:cell division protein FtsB